MKRMVVFLAVCSSIFTVMSAKEVYGGMGFVMPGYRTLSVENINEEFASHGFPQLDERNFSIGGGGYGIINGFLIGGEGHGITEKTFTNVEHKTSLKGGYGVFTMGYILASSRNFLLYPLVGVGGGMIDMEISEKNTLDFDDVMTNPRRSIHLIQKNMVLDFSLNTTFSLWSNGGLMIGARVGYMMTPYTSKTTSNGLEVYNAPEVNYDGLYFGVSFGGGGYGTSKTYRTETKKNKKRVRVIEKEQNNVQHNDDGEKKEE